MAVSDSTKWTSFSERLVADGRTDVGRGEREHHGRCRTRRSSRARSSSGRPRQHGPDSGDAQSLQTLSFRIRGDAVNARRLGESARRDRWSGGSIVEIGAGIGVPEFVLAADSRVELSVDARRRADRGRNRAPSWRSRRSRRAMRASIAAKGARGSSRARSSRRDVITSTPPPTSSASSALSLAPLRPNPLRAAESGGATTIEFALPTAGDVGLAVFDVAGREVARLASRWFPAGSHHVSWAAHGAAPGVYLVRLESAGAVATRKLTIMD